MIFLGVPFHLDPTPSPSSLLGEVKKFMKISSNAICTFGLYPEGRIIEIRPSGRKALPMTFE